MESLPRCESRVFPASLDGAFEFYPAGAATTPIGYTVEVALDVPAVEALRPIWKTWANSLDTDLDFFLHRLRQGSTSLVPYVITVYLNGNAVAMLIGQIRKRKASAVVSFIKVPGPKMRVLEIKRGGRMGRQSPEIDRVLAEELFKAAQSGGVDTICFERLPLDSELFRQIQRIPGFFMRERVPHVFCYSVLSFNGSNKKDRQVFSGKMLREMRRKTRIVDAAFPGQVSLKCFSQQGELDAGMNAAMRVAVTTWQHGLGQGFNDKAETKDNYLFFAERGWLRIFVLYIRDVPCAFLSGQLYDNKFYCQYAGYLPDYARYSVGAVLTAHVFEQLASSGVLQVDLGEGGQEHNRRIGCQMVEEGTVHVYSPTLRGVCLNLFFGTTQVVRTCGRRVRSRLRLDRLGRAWRHYLLSRRQLNKPAAYASRAQKMF